MAIKPRNFQILFLLLSLGSVVISTIVFFVFADQIGSDSLKKEAMRTVGVAAEGKYDSLVNRLHFQKQTLDNLLTVEMDLCGDGSPKQVESCIKNSMTQFYKIQKVQALYLEKSNPEMALHLGKPTRELGFDRGLKKGQFARFYNGGGPHPYYLMQSETADKKSRIVVEFSASLLDVVFASGNIGKNGESFLVDPEGFFLTNHKYQVESGKSHAIDAKPMVMCLGGNSGETVGLDYAGMPIIHGFRYIPEIGGGCIMVHIDQREAFAGLDEFTKKWGVASILLWAVLGVISYLTSVKLADQLKKNLDVVEESRRKVQESEKLFRSLFEGAPVGIVLFNAEGACIMANEASAKIIGGTREEMVYQNFRELDSWKLYGLKDAAIRSLDTLQSLRLEANPVTSFGRNVVLDFQYTPISIDGRQHLMAMFNDITHLRQAEANMKAAKEEAEEATRLKDKFITLLSHDLKTPLIGMLGMMQLLQKQPQIPPENLRMIDLAIQSNKRMIRMIDQLLDINRIRSGKLQMKPCYCDGASIIRQAVEAVEEIVAEKGIIIQDLVPDKTMVSADPAFLHEVFSNLLTNAIKFSGRGKTVTIRYIPGEEMVFAVEDNGIGIPPDIMKNLFSYHEKTTRRGTQGETGTGFGLPLAADIMEAHNGKLKAESRPEGGTAFKVILPNPAPNLLIMESSAGSCGALKEMLEERGFKVTASSHALKILEMLKEKRFDFLLVQLSDAKETGAELLRLVALDQTLKGLSLLAIGDHECHGKIGDNGGIDAIIDCGAENAKVIERIYAVLMADGSAQKG